MFPSACLCVERCWPAPAAPRKTKPQGVPAPGGEASPPQTANTRNPTLTLSRPSYCFKKKNLTTMLWSKTKLPANHGRQSAHHCFCVGRGELINRPLHLQILLILRAKKRMWLAEGWETEGGVWLTGWLKGHRQPRRRDQKTSQDLTLRVDWRATWNM